MTSRFDLKPHIGAGHLRFGMTYAMVEELIGAASRKKKGFLGETIEYRRENGLLTTYGLNTNELVEVGFSRNIIELEYEGIKLFTDPPRDVFSSLVNIDGSPYESVGFIVLLNLGMTLTGFHDDDIYQRAVTVFARGRWDGQLSDLKPFDLANF